MNSFINRNCILIVQEIENHPDSIIDKIKNCFESINIIYINSTIQLQNFKEKPLFDEKWLLLFENIYIFEQVYKSMDLRTVFPVFLTHKVSDRDILKDLLNTANIPYYIFTNPFTKEDATKLILDLAPSTINSIMVNRILSKTGVSPKRITEAIMIMDSVGYTVSNINKYLDKNVFVNTSDVLDALLHHTKMTKTKYKAVLNYLMIYRNSYKSYIKKELLKEIELYIHVYNDILNGIHMQKGVQEYIKSVDSLTNYKYMHILELFEYKSINQLKVVRGFIEQSNFLQFINFL